MLCSDVVVPERERLAQTSSRTSLARGVNGICPEVDLLAGTDGPHDLGAHLLHRDVEALENTRRDALLLAQRAEQDVLGTEVPM